MLRQSDGASVARRLREACVHWSDAHCLEKDSLPAGVAGAQIRREIPSAFVAQSLLSAGPFARLARRHARSPVCLTVYRPIGPFPLASKSVVWPLPRGRFVGSASEIRVQLPKRVDHR